MKLTSFFGGLQQCTTHHRNGTMNIGRHELLLLQGGCAVLPQPHPEEAVVDDIAAIVLVDEFSID